MNMNRLMQKGSVSLFIVIFAALLILTVGTAFVVIMIQGQSQATSDDLSRSALDSANAGVEDAKRAIAAYGVNNCASSTTGPCPNLKSALTSSDPTNPNAMTSTCKATISAGVATATSGTTVQVGSDSSLDQAYTCVNVQLNTPDYEGSLAQGESRLIPLTGVTDFDTVEVSWFSEANFTTAGGGTMPLANGTGSLTMPTSGDWHANLPTVMRAQLLEVPKTGSFKLTNFNPDPTTQKNPCTNTATFFLYPVSAGATTLSCGVTNPVGIKCTSTFTTNAYACTADLDPALTGVSATNRSAYLRLTALYNTSTDFSVTLKKAGTTVYFSGVQPIVDSTGRANDLYRRVSDRVEVGSVPYPDGALDVGHNLCKAFTVGSSASDYSDGGCTP